MSDKITDIEGLRQSIDETDAEISRLLERRLSLAREIGAYKRMHGLPITDTQREEAVLESRKKAAGEHASSAEPLFRLLIEESKRVQRADLNVYLIGMPDCGKTRMGKKLARTLELPLLDTDKFIMARMGMSIDEIFASMGEEAFRQLETMVLSEAVRRGGHIVATGGGMPLWGDNGRLLQNSGVTVFLDRRLEALLGQSAQNRPLLREGGDINANITRLYNERHDKYKALADVVIDPDEVGAAEKLAESIKDYIARS